MKRSHSIRTLYLHFFSRNENKRACNADPGFIYLVRFTFQCWIQRTRRDHRIIFTILPLSCSETYFDIFKSSFVLQTVNLFFLPSLAAAPAAVGTSCKHHSLSAFGLCMKLLLGNCYVAMALQLSEYFWFVELIFCLAWWLESRTLFFLQLGIALGRFHIFDWALLTKVYCIFRMTVDGEVAITTEFALWKCKVLFVTVMSLGLGVHVKLKFVSMDY